MPTMIRVRILAVRSAFALVLACLLAISMACSGSAQQSGASTPLPADAPAAAHLAAMFENLAVDLGAGKRDCDVLADRLQRFNEDNRERYPELQREAILSDMEPAARADYERRVHAALDAIVGAVSVCSEHPRAQKAFTVFDVLVDPR